jgi:hypothetical protein
VISVPVRRGAVPPGDLRVLGTSDAADGGEPLQGADSADKVHDLALASLFVDED